MMFPSLLLLYTIGSLFSLVTEVVHASTQQPRPTFVGGRESPIQEIIRKESEKQQLQQQQTNNHQNHHHRNNNNNHGGGALEIPLIDLSRDDDDEALIHEIARACKNPGFFQVMNHGIPQPLMDSFREQCQRFFALDDKTKQLLKRQANNARGFFDDELTKQVRDWKECLDVGMPASRDWTLPDDDARNACLDGYNRFPPATTENLSEFRNVTIQYFAACETLSHRLALLMARGLGLSKDDPFITDMAANHSSYLRTNHYPPFETTTEMEAGLWPLGISPHKDAGFLTVLLQDDDCHSLQVPCHGNHDGGRWAVVKPVPGALTINTGDMAQVWSNGIYQAPLHRVLTTADKPRYSAPFFYNPPYHAKVEPVVQSFSTTTTTTTTTTTEQPPSQAQYHPILWSYFRALRFAGDLTDLGVEIQIEDFETKRDDRPSPHLKRQEAFLQRGLAQEPFDVEKYREIM